MRQYVIWSFEHGAWWGPDHCGYTEDLEQAGRYNSADAGQIVVDSVWLEEVAILIQVAEMKGKPKFHPFTGDKKQ